MDHWEDYVEVLEVAVQGVNRNDMKTKKMFSRVVIYLLTTLVYMSCETKESGSYSFSNITTRNIELDYSTVNKDNLNITLSINDIFDEATIDYISLQPNKNGDGLIVSPRSIIHLENDSWLVNDPRNTKRNALLFDKNGNFIKYIGEKGDGPGEYVIAGHCKVNSIKKQIEILDGVRNIMLYYDYSGNYIGTTDIPFLFSDIIQDTKSDGFFAYTLNNNNNYYMKNFGLQHDYVIIKTDNLYIPQYGIEEITLTPDISPFKNNGNKLFYYESNIGFINNYSNDLYLIDEYNIKSFVSFRINGMNFQNPEFIKTGTGTPFKETLESGFSFVIDLSVSNERLLETIMVESKHTDRKYDKVYLSYSFKNKEYIFYNYMEDSSYTYSIGRYYLETLSSNYDAYAVIHPKYIEEMEETDHPRRKLILDMLEENNHNPILALLKFK